jgi:hypothetical protein
LANKTEEQIESCSRILREIQPASVRAVAYQMFVGALLLDMSKASTALVSRRLGYAREHNIVPWEWVVDETREPERVPQWDDPAQFARVVQNSFRRDHWLHQRRRVEVWSEKGTLRGTLAPVLDSFGVTFRVLHGYSSKTVAHDVAEESLDNENPLLVFYCGDWDPSGLDMSESDLPNRIVRKYGGSVEIRRVALVGEDLDGLPSFDAITKVNDTRYKWFVKNYGDKCWEVDALSPVILRKRIARCIRAEIDSEAWARLEAVERAERESLEEVMAGWKVALKFR